MPQMADCLLLSSRPQMFPLLPYPSTICHSTTHLQGLRKSQLSLGSCTEACHLSVTWWCGLALPPHGSALTRCHKCHFCSCLDTLKYNFLAKGIVRLIQVLPSPGPAQITPTCHAAGVIPVWMQLTEGCLGSNCGQLERLTEGDGHKSRQSSLETVLGLVSWRGIVEGHGKQSFSWE